MKRRIAFFLLLFLSVVACVWCAYRWEVWFGNPDEAPYVPSTVPSRVLLTFGTSDAKDRNVSWQCGAVVQSSWVELVDTVARENIVVPADGEVFQSRSGKAAYYVARLRNLKAGHTYRYRVHTGEESSAWYAFHVGDKTARPVTFLYVGDVQDTLGGVANRLLRDALARVPETEFIVSGGDLVERPTDAYWGEAFATLDSVGQSLPALTVTGNHDYIKGVVGQLERRFPLVHSYFLDSSVGENMVFALRYGDVQLFCLDSNREFFYLARQRQWLKEHLACSTAKWKVLVSHHPLYSIRGNANNLVQRWMFADLVEDYGVDLVLQGHEHAYARMTFHDAQGEPIPPVYTVSHCSPKNYGIEFDERFDKFGTGSRYYQTVRVCGDTLFLSATDANTHSLYDSLLIVKRKDSVRVLDRGSDIAEQLDFVPVPGNRKDEVFAERINAYKHKKKLTNHSQP